MSRSGYSDSLDNWELIRWRGQLMSSIRGKRGQAFIKDLITALEAMPEKRLIREDLIKDGEVCALGALGVHRKMDVNSFDPYDFEGLASEFNITHQIIQEIEFINDEGCRYISPEKRWESVLKWAKSQVVPHAP